MAGERWDVCLTPFEALKAPEMGQAFPPSPREDQEKYSPPQLSRGGME
jgi:hypothetical protein